jgi:hypothetical protein
MLRKDGRTDGRKDGSVTISLRNFVGKGIKRGGGAYKKKSLVYMQDSGIVNAR